MLTDYLPMPTLAVSDLSRARAFYEGTLGLVPDGEISEGVRYRAGAGAILVYPSAYAGTNKATALSFQVPPDAFDTEVDRLRSAGLTFETFDAPDTTWAEGVATMGGTRGVWFTDPDGNILNVETS